MRVFPSKTTCTCSSEDNCIHVHPGPQPTSHNKPRGRVSSGVQCFDTPQTTLLTSQGTYTEASCPYIWEKEEIRTVNLKVHKWIHVVTLYCMYSELATGLDAGYSAILKGATVWDNRVQKRIFLPNLINIWKRWLTEPGFCPDCFEWWSKSDLFEQF